MDVQQRGVSMPAVRHISTCTVRHSRVVREEERRCHLNPWDLRYLSIHYIQKGLVFLEPTSSHGAVDGGGSGGGKDRERYLGEGEEPLVVALLKRSLAATLDHFYPLCGRLATVHHPDDGTVSIFIDCTNQGAEFIHAEADLTVSDLLGPPFTPRIVRSFFPLNGDVSHDGHSLPLLAVQFTQLRDGYFIGCSMNHSAADGSSFWHFFNSWSSVARGGSILLPPVVDRWFPESLRPPLRLPCPHGPDGFLQRPVIPADLEDAVFHFPRHAIAALKARANAEVGDGGSGAISSLQALLAHVWRATTRARGLSPDHTTTYGVAVGLRQRLQPRPPPGYLGNLIRAVKVAATAGKLLDLPLGRVAEKLNRGIASQTDASARSWAESWGEAPAFLYVGPQPGYLLTGSSPRFDVYGNDFGWGRPVGVRSGIGNKLDGMLTIYPGADEGSMDLEMYLPREVLLALMADEEFTAVVSVGSTPRAAEQVSH